MRGLTDSSGDAVELYAYSVYGKQSVLSRTGSVLAGTAFNNNYGFTGRYLDEETGLWYFRARYFNDEMGRFISRDPLGYVDVMSLYNGYFAERFSLDPEGLSTYVFVYDTNDPMFLQWANAVKAKITANKKTYFNFDPTKCCGNYDEKNDKISMVPITDKGAMDALQKEEDVAYIGFFGHGADGKIWWDYKIKNEKIYKEEEMGKNTGDRSHLSGHRYRSLVTGTPGYKINNKRIADEIPFDKLIHSNPEKCILVEFYHCASARIVGHYKKKFYEKFSKDKYELVVNGAPRGVNNRGMFSDGWPYVLPPPLQDPYEGYEPGWQ